MAAKKGAESINVEPKLLNALAYVLSWLTGIIVLIIALSKKDKKMAFHGIQAILAGIAAMILIWIIITFIWWIPFIGWAIRNIIGLLVFIAFLYMAYLVYTGKEVILPVITDLSKKLSEDIVK